MFKKGHVSFTAKLMSSIMICGSLLITPINAQSVEIKNQIVYKDTTKTTVKKKLKKFKVLSGDKEVELEGLKFSINDKLNYKGESIRKYYPVTKQNYPVMSVQVYNKSFDYTETTFNKDKFKSIIKIVSPSKSKISKINYKTVENADTLKYYTVSYNTKLNKKTKKVLSKNLKSIAAYIPTKKGIYLLSFDKYSNDKNNYKFDKVIESMDISGLSSYLDELEHKEALDKLNSEINSITVLVDANDEEKQIFDTRKQEALNLIEQNASEEDVKAKIEELKQTNADIQSRLDQEKAEKEAQINSLKSQINSINCLDGANDTERSIFNTRKQDALNTANSSTVSVDDLQNKVNQLNQTNTDIQNRITNEQIAAQQAAAAAAAAQAQKSYSSSSSYGGYGSGGYYCVDGMYVGNANPHARGRANACYGHGGFQVNH